MPATADGSANTRSSSRRAMSCTNLRASCLVTTRTYYTAHMAQDPATHGVEAIDPSPAVDSACPRAPPPAS
eukprot:6909590-Prymnesium_polylepis.3